jgi:alcohol dehydrogenase class IV
MVIPPFSCSRLPQLFFGCGMRTSIPKLLPSGEVLLITGSRSFENSPWFPELVMSLRNNNLHLHHEHVAGEPSPDLVNTISDRYRSKNIAVVLAVGGGSVMDCGKAVSAMLTVTHPVEEYLEGIGTREHPVHAAF